MGSLLDQLRGGRTSKPKSRSAKPSKSKKVGGKYGKKTTKVIKKPGKGGKGKP
jgi:hypothetical protein